MELEELRFDCVWPMLVTVWNLQSREHLKSSMSSLLQEVNELC